ncbi:MAG: hypothetical protein ACI4RA_01435, partial [Kiritimatiellia bacterium]
EVPLAADRHVVSWTCPPRARPPVDLHANLVAEAPRTRSLWQRVPSWLVKFEATRRDEKGNPIYRLVQCETQAGMQSVLTDAFLARGNGRWTLSFDLRARSETPFDLEISLLSNEKRHKATVKALETPSAEKFTPWTHHIVQFDTDFDLSVTDLVALSILSTAPADEIEFRNLSFHK